MSDYVHNKHRIISLLLAIVMFALPAMAMASEDAEEYAKEAIGKALTDSGYESVTQFNGHLYNEDGLMVYSTEITYKADNLPQKSAVMMLFSPDGSSYSTKMIVVGKAIVENHDESASAKDQKEFVTLKNGSKGDDVEAVQKRLKELGYLSGNADGSYGNKTASAVNKFQSAAGLTTTGNVDKATYDALMSSSAPAAPKPKNTSNEYEKLDYKAVARNPDDYLLTKIKFDGKVIQVVEGDKFNVYRIASKGSYDNVVYVEYTLPKGASRILEDDKVTVYGTCLGVYSYTTVMGSEITIPACLADEIVLK